MQDVFLTSEKYLIGYRIQICYKLISTGITKFVTM